MKTKWIKCTPELGWHYITDEQHKLEQPAFIASLLKGYSMKDWQLIETDTKNEMEEGE